MDTETEGIVKLISILDVFYEFMSNHTKTEYSYIFILTFAGLLYGFPFILLALYFFLRPLFCSIKIVNGSVKTARSNYNYSIGSIDIVGRNNAYGMVIDLGAKVPHFFVNAYSNDHIISAQKAFKNIEKLQLEGDFYKDFVIWGNRQDVNDILVLFNPKTMLALSQYNNKCDIEFIDTYVYITMKHWDMYKDKDYKKLLLLANGMINGIDSTLYNQKHKTSEKDFAKLELAESDVSIMTVKKGGYSLRHVLGSIILAGVITFFYKLLAQQDAGMILYVFSAISSIVIGSIAYVVFSNKKIDITL